MNIDLSGILDAPATPATQTALAEKPAPPIAATTPTPAAPTQTRSTKRTTKQPLYFDLETVPDEERMHLFELDPLPELLPETPLANLMAPEEFLSQTLDVIRKWLETHNPPAAWLATIETTERQGKNRKGLMEAIGECRNAAAVVAAAAAERQKLMSITPEYCRIVAVGAARGDAEINGAVVGLNGITEEDLIESLWLAIDECGPLVGFNVLWFDLPTLFIRSAILGVKPAKRLDLKAWGNDVVDLAKSRFPSATPKGMGLKTLARLYGIPVSAGDTDGSDVYRLWKEEPAKLAEYVKSDVEITRKLHRFYAGFFTP